MQTLGAPFKKKSTNVVSLLLGIRLSSVVAPLLLPLFLLLVLDTEDEVAALPSYSEGNVSWNVSPEAKEHLFGCGTSPEAVA